MKATLITLLSLILLAGSGFGQSKRPKLRASKNFWYEANGTRHPPVHFSHLSRGRTLAAVGDTLYMLDHRKRILWRWTSNGPPLNDIPFVDSRGTIYVIGMDLLWAAIDSANGNEKWRGTANGRATYWQMVAYKRDMYFVTINMASYRLNAYPGEVINDHLGLCRGNSILWATEIPPGAILRVRGANVVILVKRNQGIQVKRVVVPTHLGQPIGRVSALADYN